MLAELIHLTRIRETLQVLKPPRGLGRKRWLNRAVRKHDGLGIHAQAPSSNIAFPTPPSQSGAFVCRTNCPVTRWGQNLVKYFFHSENPSTKRTCPPENNRKKAHTNAPRGGIYGGTQLCADAQPSHLRSGTMPIPALHTLPAFRPASFEDTELRAHQRILVTLSLPPPAASSPRLFALHHSRPQSCARTKIIFLRA